MGGDRTARLSINPNSIAFLISAMASGRSRLIFEWVCFPDPEFFVRELNRLFISIG